MDIDSVLSDGERLQREVVRHCRILCPLRGLRDLNVYESCLTVNTSLLRWLLRSVSVMPLRVG